MSERLPLPGPPSLTDEEHSRIAEIAEMLAEEVSKQVFLEPAKRNSRIHAKLAVRTSYPWLVEALAMLTIHRETYPHYLVGSMQHRERGGTHEWLIEVVHAPPWTRHMQAQGGARAAEKIDPPPN